MNPGQIVAVRNMCDGGFMLGEFLRRAEPNSTYVLVRLIGDEEQRVVVVWDAMVEPIAEA